MLFVQVFLLIVVDATIYNNPIEQTETAAISRNDYIDHMEKMAKREMEDIANDYNGTIDLKDMVDLEEKVIEDVPIKQNGTVKKMDMENVGLKHNSTIKIENAEGSAKKDTKNVAINIVDVKNTSEKHMIGETKFALSKINANNNLIKSMQKITDKNNHSK